MSSLDEACHRCIDTNERLTFIGNAELIEIQNLFFLLFQVVVERRDETSRLTADTYVYLTSLL